MDERKRRALTKAIEAMESRGWQDRYGEDTRLNDFERELSRRGYLLSPIMRGTSLGPLPKLGSPLNSDTSS